MISAGRRLANSGSRFEALGPPAFGQKIQILTESQQTLIAAVVQKQGFTIRDFFGGSFR